MKFSELVDINELHELCKSFTAITGAVTAILDLEGTILTATTEWQDICTCFHRGHPETAIRCRESDTVLAGRLGKGERYNVYKCRNGLIDVAVPITIGGEHVANLFTGQFFFEPPDREYFIRQAEEFGFDKDSYIAALNKVPILSEDKVRSMMEFFTRLAQLIGEMGLASKNLEEANEELHKHQEHLEELVLERTAELSGANRELQAGIAERNRAEKALRESETKFSKAFQSMPSVLVIASLAEGRYTEVNEAFERVMGYRRDEVIGRSSLELNIWQNPEDRANVIRMLAEGSAVRDLEIGFRSKSGAIIVGLYSAEIIEIGAERCLLSLMNDITARKKAEEELRYSEERYRLLYNETPVMLHSIDHDGRLVSVSNYWLETLGYERSEVLGRRTTEFLTEASRFYATEVVLPDFFRTGSCKEVPYQMVKKNGEILDALLSAIAERDSEGKVVRSLAVMVDVTERKRAEEARRKSEKKFLTVFHAVPALLGITTLKEGRFIDINETCVRILGYQRDELIGRTSLQLGIWESQADRERAMRALEEQGTVRDIEINLRGKTGERFVGLMSAEFIDIDGEQYVLSMINDITDRKQAAEEIERLHTDLAARAVDLEMANRELETFNYTVAHDLRKPLTVVNGYCQAIKELCGLNLDETCKDFLQEAYDGTLRMNQLIDALLNFSRLTHVEPRRETVDLSDVAQAVAAELQLSEPARRVVFRITEGIEANGDPNLLRVVLDNLLGNAWKYTATRDEGIIEFGATEVDGKPAWFVRDNGTGIDMADAEKMFQPFQRLPGAETCRGFGIGLATVERIIRRHGGRIWAEGEPGKRTTLYFTLGDD